MMKKCFADLELIFKIVRQDDEGWPWIITLNKIEPRGTGLDKIFDSNFNLFSAIQPQKKCGICATKVGDMYEQNPGLRVCDACAVEEWIANCGSEEWLIHCEKPIITDPLPDDARFIRPVSPEIIINCEGMLTVIGHVEWCYDYEIFVIKKVSFKEFKQYAS